MPRRNAQFERDTLRAMAETFADAAEDALDNGDPERAESYAYSARRAARSSFSAVDRADGLIRQARAMAARQNFGAFGKGY